MKFALLIFSLVSKQFLHRIDLTSELSKSKSINIYDGYDHRYFNANNNSILNNTAIVKTEHQTSTLEDMYRLNDYFYKFKLLKKLTSPTISEAEKLAEIERYESYNNSKYTVDLTAGGLYKDWEMTLL
jgi:hypothetical protein